MPATIVSIMPFGFRDEKPGLAPGDFQMKAASPEKPEIHVVKVAQIRMMDQDYRPFMLDVDHEKVAADVCDCHNKSQIVWNDDAIPGLFWVKGEHTAEEVVKKFAKEIAEAKRKQDNWFRMIVKIADDDWSKWHQHKYISDLQRTAARSLNLEREWVKDDVNMNTRCPACQSIISTEAAVCFACKAVVNEEKYKQFKFAG